MSTAKTPHERASIEISTLPGQAAKGRWRIDSLRALTSHGIFWITRGQGRITLGPTTRGITPNSLLFIPAGRVHALHLKKSMLGYAAFLPDSLPVPVPDNPALIKATSIFEQGQITSYFEQVATEYSSDAPGRDNAMESYLTLLSIWIERHQPRNDWQGRQDLDAAARLAEKFLLLLEKKYHSQQTVAAYADLLGVTSTHLSRCCNEVFGKPASDLIQARLIAEARLLLADGDQKIGQIATQLGFTSAAYFARLFRQHTGQSPRAFRINPIDAMPPSRSRG